MSFCYKMMEKAKCIYENIFTDYVKRKLAANFPRIFVCKIFYLVLVVQPENKHHQVLQMVIV